MEIVTLFTEAAGLSILIFALVAQLKQFGICGNWLTGSAYLVGLLFGGMYRFFFHPPATPADWFLTVTFGLICGLIATGTYKGIESASSKPSVVVNQTGVGDITVKVPDQSGAVVEPITLDEIMDRR